MIELSHFSWHVLASHSLIIVKIILHFLTWVPDLSSQGCRASSGGKWDLESQARHWMCSWLRGRCRGGGTHAHSHLRLRLYLLVFTCEGFYSFARQREGTSRRKRQMPHWAESPTGDSIPGPEPPGARAHLCILKMIHSHRYYQFQSWLEFAFLFFPNV